MKTAAFFTFFSLVHLTASSFPNVLCKTADVPDYYWREFVGVIPFDAVPGGTDRASFTTYIGQALVYPYGQLLASIYQGNTTVVASAELKSHYADRNVKILCSGSPEKFKWIATETSKIQLITHCNLILGGVDRTHPLNIGRANYREEIVLGKILTTAGASNGLWVPENGSETQFEKFEVLAYNCKRGVDIPIIT